MVDYYPLVKDNATDRSELTKRQDEDVLLRNLDAYIMKDADNKKVSGVINITLNRPKVMAAYIISALGNTLEQILVETEDRNLDTDYIKDFLGLAFAAADARLRRNGLWDINLYLDEQSCIRGGAAARCLFRMEGDILIPDITYWDYRYVNYEMGIDGLDWAAYGYGTKRKKAAIESEQWWQKDKPTISGKEAEVVDVWHTKGNEIFLNGMKVFEQPHPYGFTPVAIQSVPLGSMLADKDDIKNQGESIFFLIREAIPELNRLVSILQTLNLKAIKPPSQTFRKEGAIATPPDYNKVMDPGSSTSADIGGGTQIIDMGDARRAAVMALNVIDRNLQEGGLTSSDLGFLTSPPPSGIALIQIKEGRDQIYLPRLKTKSLIKQMLSEMIIAQVIGTKEGIVEIGRLGHKRKFQTGKLEGQYEITHKFSAKSLAAEAGLASLCAALGNSIPDRAKRRDILQRQDPDGDERWLRWEEAERLSPLIKLRRIAKDLIELDEEEEAKLITDEAGIQLEQLLSGGAKPLKPEPTEEPKQVISLWGGGQGGGRKPAIPMPVEGEEE